MTTNPIPESDRAESDRANPIDRAGVRSFLEGLARIHRWILVTDARRNVVWTSARLSELFEGESIDLGTDARDLLTRLPRPQQILPLRSSLRSTSHVTAAPIDFEMREGRAVALDLDLARIDSEAGELLLVIASERGPEDGPDAELLDAIPEALLAIDADGFVRRANPAALRLLESSRDRVLARPITALLGDATGDLESLAEVLVGRAKDARCELGLRSGAGALRQVAIRMAPVANGHRVLLLRDVTEERETEQQLRKASSELDHCVGALAHDLRSPLAGLLGFSRLLREDYGASLGETGRHFIGRIEQAARTMESLIHDLLELARIGAPGEEPGLVDPREVLLQLAAELKPRLEASGIELDLCDGPPSRVYCDRTRLYQLFSNLIGNAIDHMGAHPDARIAVEILERENEHEIVVSDNGKGVEPSHRERIFEIFQSIGTRTGGVRGTGMGLAIVRKIADKHGGRAWVDGEPGEGARFHVALPRR